MRHSLTIASKRILARLPRSWRQSLRRSAYGRQVRSGRFVLYEPEFHRLGDWIGSGDWVIDVGANIGIYTIRCSDLVGPKGRVIALEPVPATFELLASNCGWARHRNITLLNLAASDHVHSTVIRIPRAASGLDDHFSAELVKSNEASSNTEDSSSLVPSHLVEEEDRVAILGAPLDGLMPSPPQRIKLIKIDTEGHEIHVLKGADRLIRRDRPVIILEANEEAATYLRDLGYSIAHAPGSPNYVAEPAPIPF